MRYGIGEVFEMAAEAKTDEEKIKILKDNDSTVIRNVALVAFDPDTVWDLPDKIEYKESQLPGGMGDTNLAMEWRRMYIYLKNDKKHPDLPMEKRVLLFTGLLESLDMVEQKFLLKLKDKKIVGLEAKHIKAAYPGLLPSLGESIVKNVKTAADYLSKKNVSEVEQVKRGRGRPKKIRTEEELREMNKPKRPRGRPRKVKE